MALTYIIENKICWKPWFLGMSNDFLCTELKYNKVYPLIYLNEEIEFHLNFTLKNKF
jgi:hypothetical protein